MNIRATRASCNIIMRMRINGSIKPIVYTMHMRSAIIASLTLGAHAQRGLQYLVCVSVSVCLLPRFLPLRATRRPKSDTNGFSATLALFCDFGKNAAFESYGVKELICKLALAYLDQLCVPWRRQKL